MLLALATLLIQPMAALQAPFSAEKMAVTQQQDSDASDVIYSAAASLPVAPVPMNLPAPPAADPNTTANAASSEPAAVKSPAPGAFLKPGRSITVSVGELIAEDRRKRRIWFGLGVAAHSAATFDAWSTRHAITANGGQELNPLLKTFAGNASIYAAIQVGPALMDYAGKKMMYSRHAWVRHLWWVPQSASFASSLLCGAHNLRVHAGDN